MDKINWGSFKKCIVILLLLCLVVLGVWFNCNRRASQPNEITNHLISWWGTENVVVQYLDKNEKLTTKMIYYPHFKVITNVPADKPIWGEFNYGTYVGTDAFKLYLHSEDELKQLRINM